MNIKKAFYDIDGVLSIPRYERNGVLTTGGSLEWWKNFCDTHEDPYKYCGVPRMVYNNLEAQKSSGVELYVLSVETIPKAKEGKLKFLHSKYSEFFDDSHIIFVNHNEDKISMMKHIALMNDLDYEQLYFVDDTLPLVFDAIELGINGIHISQFLEEM